MGLKMIESSRKFQDKIKMSLYIVLHSIMLAHHLFVGIYAFAHFYFKDSTDPELLFVYKYKCRYLTLWNLWVQSFYSIVSITCDIQSTFIDNKYLADLIPKLKSYMLMSIIFPSAAFVSFTFWFLYNIDTELVFPKQLELLFPLWYNHCIHTNILILPLFEFFFNSSLPNYKLSFIGATLYYWIYDATVIYTYYESSKWIYKVFEVLDWKARSTYMLLNYFLTVGAMHLAMVMQKRILKYKNIKTEVQISSRKIK